MHVTTFQFHNSEEWGDLCSSIIVKLFYRVANFSLPVFLYNDHHKVNKLVWGFFLFIFFFQHISLIEFSLRCFYVTIQTPMIRLAFFLKSHFSSHPWEWVISSLHQRFYLTLLKPVIRLCSLFFYYYFSLLEIF